MRLQRLELARYGGYEGRSLDFGDGHLDLHLIIGPNESGKSTLLSAIGDLLFGFSRPTLQNWRFETKDLRLAASIADGHRTLRVARRNGLKNTLLGADDTPLPDDILDPLLGGLNRAAFDRLFGLDAAKLRAGGQAILAGKDDAAQSLFEAGTGMAAVGAKLKQLEAECGELFKPSASKPRINQLLRERQESVDTLRVTTLSEADWTKLHGRRSRAEAARADLIAEDKTLGARMNDLERLARARAPLRRLDEARSEVARLGPLPSLHADAARILADARAERATTLELKSGHQRKRDRASSAIAAIALPEAILAVAARIDALEERRAEIDRMRKDLPRKAATLDEIEAAIAAARQASGLADSARLPTSAWRRRARIYLEARRALETRARKHSEGVSLNRHERQSAAEALTQAPEQASLADLKDALAALSPDAIKRIEMGRAASERAAQRAVAALSSLGWNGSADALASARLPSLAEASDQERRARVAREAVEKARENAQAAGSEARRCRAKLDELAAGGPLPTPAVVAEGREARDHAFEEVRARLGHARQPDDAEAASRLALAIGKADLLADARDAASRQIAEHAVTLSALAIAEGTGLAAEGDGVAAGDELATAQAEWSKITASAGMPDALGPSGFPAWKDGRDHFIVLRNDAQVAADEYRREQTSMQSAEDQLSRALAVAGFSIEGDLTSRLNNARSQARRMETISRDRLGLLVKASELERAADGLAREAEAMGEDAAAIDGERVRLLEEAKISAAVADLLEDVLDGLDEVTPQVGARPGLAQDVQGMNRDIAGFDDEVSTLLSDLSRPASPSASDAVRLLALDLKSARTSSKDLANLGAVIADEDEALEGVDRRLGTAQVAIGGLLTSAGVQTEDELDAVMVVLARRAAATQAESAAHAELAEVSGGIGPEDLSLAAGEIDEGSAQAERELIEARRQEIATEREAIGGELKDVVLAIERAEIATDAADAQQNVAEVRAALGASAERYIEVAAAVALLRWLIERHRAGAQAPLLARAGVLFKTVTREAFEGVALDYDDDRPRIVAVRPDRSRVGIEGLTEGTRDQLYLALRLGSLQARAGQGAPPLVCDDLLVSSDNERAGAMLRVLKEASESLQVLVFTHHPHIENVARQALGEDGFHVHRLTPTTLDAAV